MVEQLLHCDGKDQTIKANQFCLIPMPVLRDAPYSLVLSNPVVVTIEGYNIIGYSVPSVKNTAGAVIRTQPLVPINAVYRVDEGTTDVKIKA